MKAILKVGNIDNIKEIMDNIENYPVENIYIINKEDNKVQIRYKDVEYDYTESYTCIIMNDISFIKEDGSTASKDINKIISEAVSFEVELAHELIENDIRPAKLDISYAEDFLAYTTFISSMSSSARKCIEQIKNNSNIEISNDHDLENVIADFIYNKAVKTIYA